MAVATDKQRPGEQVRALARVRKLRDAAREALSALRELERVTELDVWGRYEVAADDALDTEDLAAWAALARRDYPGQPMELLLVVRVGGG